MRLLNKKCVITAAAQGIGLATSLAFSKEGATIIAVDINAEKLSDLKKQNSKIETVILDVTDFNQVDNFIKNTGKIDVLFNCAGWVAAGSILECDTESWKKSFQINVDSMFRLIQGFLPEMIKNNDGSIINMSSAASSVKGVVNRFAYSCSKAAVLGLTKSVAADYVKTGIRCNAICPGTVESPSLKERITAQAKLENKTEEEIYNNFVARQPLGRLGTTQEIANLAIYLASDESKFTTGTFNIIDGGWSM